MRQSRFSMMKANLIFATLIFSLINYGQCFIGNNIFQTRNPALFEAFCVQNGDELEDIGQTTSTHEAITIRGVKRSVIALFKDLTPNYDPPSEDSSLSDIFQ